MSTCFYLCLGAHLSHCSPHRTGQEPVLLDEVQKETLKLSFQCTKKLGVLVEGQKVLSQDSGTVLHLRPQFTLIFSQVPIYQLT